MKKCQLIIKENIQFDSDIHALKYISHTLHEKGIVKESHLEALLARENSFPTGIALEGYAVAIPHCEAEHANEPAIMLIRLDQPIAFNRADEDSTIDISIILALVVTDPKDQLSLLRALFSNLQNKTFYQSLLNSSQDDINQLFEQTIFNTQNTLL